jgi:Zn-dependent protease with chaperone function
VVYPRSMGFLLGWRYALSGLVLLAGVSSNANAQSAAPKTSHSLESTEGAENRVAASSPTSEVQDWNGILAIFAKAQWAVQLRNLPVARSIQLAQSTHASAFVYRRHDIRLSKPLIETLQSEDQLAFAISHEMAHIALGHASQASESQEFAADAFAASILTDIGMDVCASTTALEALQRREPTYRTPLVLRARYLRKTLLAACPPVPSEFLALRESPIVHPFH